jgi:biopolymer transport protein ExbB/TolQ
LNAKLHHKNKGGSCMKKLLVLVCIGVFVLALSGVSLAQEKEKAPVTPTPVEKVAPSPAKTAADLKANQEKEACELEAKQAKEAAELKASQAKEAKELKAAAAKEKAKEKKTE